MQNKKRNKGITLVALVVTIIILLILAGISIASLTKNGLLRNTQIASEEYKKEVAREELQMAVMEIQTEFSIKSETITMEKLVTELKTNQTQYLQEDIEKLNLDGKEGIYRGYSFYITPNTYEIVFEKEGTEVFATNKNIIFDRGTYISTDVQESELLKNNEFTIAAQIYIDEGAQKTVNYMDILGNHNNGEGFVWQFSETSNILTLGTYDQMIQIDYTPYYNQWVDIIMTYKDGAYKVYFNKVLVGEQNDITMIPYSNLLIGTGYINENRAMRGMISSVKIWTKALEQSLVNNINMLVNTEIEKENLQKEIYFQDENSINNFGQIVGNNYIITDYKEKLDYDFRLNGGTYISTNISQNDFMQNETYTIAARVKINQNEQTQVNYMDILGNHYASDGIVWQFTTTTNILGLHAVEVDYTPYYDQWTDIVMVLNQNQEIAYINGEKVGEVQATSIAYSNLLIGTGYLGQNRAMIGNINSVKIWNVALSENEINNLNMIDVNTNIQSNNLIKEINLKDIRNILENGTIVGGNYDYVLNI